MKSLKTKRWFQYAAGAVLAACLSCLPAMSQGITPSHWTKFTFNSPVEVPGMVLSPGRYVFQLSSVNNEQNVVQIWTADRQHLLDSFVAGSTWRMKAPNTPGLTFYEAPSGTPPAVLDWYYPGETYGWRFEYNHVPQPGMPPAADAGH